MITAVQACYYSRLRSQLYRLEHKDAIVLKVDSYSSNSHSLPSLEENVKLSYRLFKYTPT